MFLFNALKFVDHVPSRLKRCDYNVSMKNLNSLSFFNFPSGLLGKNTQTDIRNQLCITRRKPVRSRRHHLTSLCTAFLLTQQTRQNDVAKPLFSCCLFKKKYRSVKFCGIFIFHQVLDMFWFFLCSLLE